MSRPLSEAEVAETLTTLKVTPFTLGVAPVAGDWGYFRLYRGSSGVFLLSLHMPGSRIREWRIHEKRLNKQGRTWVLSSESIPILAEKLTPYINTMLAEILPTGFLRSSAPTRIRYQTCWPGEGWQVLLLPEQSWVHVALLCPYREDIAQLVARCETLGRERFYARDDLKDVQEDGVEVAVCS